MAASTEEATALGGSASGRHGSPRGWVVYSIDYRVSGDYGTLPSSYPELPAELTEAQIEQAHALYPACRDAKAAIRSTRLPTTTR